MKPCRTCKVSREATDFSKDRSQGDGLNSECRPCQKARYDGLTDEQITARNAKAVAWNAANPTRSRERALRWTRNNPEKAAASQKRWYDGCGKTVQRASRLRREYGLSIEEFDAILNAQSGACKICGTTKPDGNGWHIDHEHSTSTDRRKLVRGILCYGCNVGLGFFKDSTELLKTAIEYLESHNKKT